MADGMQDNLDTGIADPPTSIRHAVACIPCLLIKTLDQVGGSLAYFHIMRLIISSFITKGARIALLRQATTEGYRRSNMLHSISTGEY